MNLDPEKIYQIALTMIPKIGDVSIRQLISYCGSASAVFEAKPHKLLKIPGIGKVLSENIQNKSVLEKAQTQLDLSLKHNAQMLFYTDAAYPKRMKQLYDAPVMMYYKGNADLNQTKTIAIVGTRQVTEYGKMVTDQIVAELSVFNPLIVSGLAYGVDIVAHKSALKNKIQTVGVMASGLDFIYPFQHKSTSEAMVGQGGILTEYQFGVQPFPKYFPQRNRIIAGMTDLTIVVEASPKGGALITAEFAYNYHRDVFAVPGQLGKSFSEGCNQLIKSNKAQIYTSVNDIV
ncbi:MAG: DNA-processing protein DprA, partial [Pseudarcicella sp.]|nr:DNA-processing protein DprA [Pseudarcicella sp.]